VAGRQRDELIGTAVEERFTRDEERADPSPDERGKFRLEVALRSSFSYKQLPPEPSAAACPFFVSGSA
jgi:hypothetical protein